MVFYINLPFGILAAAGLAAFLPNTRGQRLRFDWLGFTVFAMGIGALQLMLDRGNIQDWLSSREIIVEAVLAALGIYLFVVHVLWSARPLIRPVLFGDLNFTLGLVMMFAVGTIMVSSLTLMTPWLEVLSNYPVATAGLVMAPRGIGNLLTIIISGRIATRMDPRYLVAAGLLMMCYTFWRMTGWTTDVSQREIITTIVIQGAGLGFVFTPLQLLAFATLPIPLRTEGASLINLSRNVGAAIGVSVTSSVLAHNAQALHEIIGGTVTPFNRALQALPPLNLGDRGAAMLDGLVNQQAQIIAYSNVYTLMIFIALPSLFLLVFMRHRQKVPGSAGRSATSVALSE
jgi:MFS transporter, DHA2 family, multidrug resistance protein